MRTLAELKARADAAVEREESFVFDVCAAYGQMFGNVQHLAWFREAVARWLTENVKVWSHLAAYLREED